MQFSRRVVEALQKANSLYYIRPYESRDYEVVRAIFSEGMLEYGPDGENIRRKAMQFEDEEFEKEYNADIAKCYPAYVAYNMVDANMTRIDEYWSLSRRSAFLVCVDRATETVIGTVGIQPLELCGFGDSHVALSVPHTLEVGKDLAKYEESVKERIPSDLYCLDNPAYDAETYVPKDCITLPLVNGEITEVDDDMKYFVPAKDAQAKLTSLNFKAKVPNGYFRRFQPCDNFSTPLPVGMTSNTYTDLLSCFDMTKANVTDNAGFRDISQDTAKEAYNYFQSLGCAADLPSPPSIHQGFQECELRRMSVTKNFRSNGAAELLIFTALQTAAKVFKFDCLHLSTSYVMDRAVNFYRRTGFRQVSVHQENVGGKYTMPIVHFRFEFTSQAHIYNAHKFYHSAHDE